MGDRSFLGRHRHVWVHDPAPASRRGRARTVGGHRHVGYGHSAAFSRAASSDRRFAGTRSRFFCRHWTAGDAAASGRPSSAQSGAPSSKLTRKLRCASGISSTSVDIGAGEEALDVEEIAGMLAIEGRDELAGVQVRNRHDLHLRIAEGSLHGACHGPDVRRVDASSEDGRDLDLDVCRVPMHRHLRWITGRRVAVERHSCSWNAVANAACDPLQCRCDIGERVGPGSNWQVGEVNVHREARQIVQEQVDGGSALQREAVLDGDVRQAAQQQVDLPAEALIHGRGPGPAVPAARRSDRWDRGGRRARACACRCPSRAWTRRLVASRRGRDGRRTRGTAA